MSRIFPRLKSNAELIEGRILEYLSDDRHTYKELIDAMRYGVSTGGKRIRPTLAIEFARLFGADDEVVIPYACAIEMIHSYSLIHDDLPCMDNDDLRRGKPTNHKVFGEAAAMLAGDALLTCAFGVAASNKNASDKQNNDAVILLSKRAGANGMCGGQMIDLDGEKRKLSYDELLEMNLLKTGALMCTSALLGCIAAGVYHEKEKAEAAEEYAKNVGLAFQVIDDLLDEGTEEEKTTFLSFMTDDEARAYAKELTGKAIEAIKDFEGSEFLCELADELLVRSI